MAVTVEMQNTGDPGLQREVVATIEHVLSDRAGDWRGSVIGSPPHGRWGMENIGLDALWPRHTPEGRSGGDPSGGGSGLGCGSPGPAGPAAWWAEPMEH